MFGVVYVCCAGGPLEGVSSFWYHVTSHGYWWLGYGVCLPTTWWKKCLLIIVWSEQECDILQSLCKGTREVYFDVLVDVHSTLFVTDHVCVRLADVVDVLQTVCGKSTFQVQGHCDCVYTAAARLLQSPFSDFLMSCCLSVPVCTRNSTAWRRSRCYVHVWLRAAFHRTSLKWVQCIGSSE